MKGLWNVPGLTRRGEPLPGTTLTELFWNAVDARRDAVWLREKRLGLWRAWTWRQVGQAVREIAMGLVALGVRPGDVVGVLANTRLEWLLADLAVISAGGVTNGIYPTDAARQVDHLCRDSSTRVLFVEDDEQLDKALEVRDGLPRLEHIVVIDPTGLRDFEDPRVTTLERLRALGAAHDREHPGRFDERRASRGPGDLAILVYTSGTTGRPKGAMHGHAGLVFSARAANHELALDAGDERVCFLPLCHIAERVLGAYAAIDSGAVLDFVERPDTFAENVREISPTVMLAVPRVWEKFHSAVTLAVKDASAVQRAAYAWAIGVGAAVADEVLAGRAVGAWAKLRFLCARWLVLDNVRRFIGLGRARALLTGAAPISPSLIRWYLSLGVPMYEGWAQTESCAIGSVTPPAQMRPGSIGRAAHGVQMRVDDATGELLLRGPNVFMGYLNQPDKTAETIDADGWLHTGDVGTVDADGFFTITDRLRDIIVTAGGKNVTPSEIENELKFSAYITDAVVIGDRRPFLVAIVMIDQDNVEKYAMDHDVAFSDYTSLTRAPEVQELIGAEIERVNAKFARVEQVRRFFLLETRLGAEDEELTPTMKLKRRFVEAKYAQRIESMYR
jgi:long-chain acyl-CoA synthetase